MDSVKANDIKFGLTQEEKIKPDLETIFGNLKKTSKYHNFDFYNDKFYIEVKSRKKCYKEYPTWWFDNCKRLKAKKLMKEEGVRCFFVWNLLDGIYLWEYKNIKSQQDNEYYLQEGGRWDRQEHGEVSKLVNVRSQYLIDINNFIFD